MTIHEAVDDIKVGVTKRESLGLAVRSLESFDMMKNYFQDRTANSSGDKKEVFLESLDLVNSVIDLIERKGED